MKEVVDKITSDSNPQPIEQYQAHKSVQPAARPRPELGQTPNGVLTNRTLGDMDDYLKHTSDKKNRNFIKPIKG